MKREINIALSLCALFLFSNAAFSQSIPSYVPTNGLIAWYPFNGNANDESGNGNHGTVNGATLAKNRYGQINQSYLFNGFSSYIKTNLTRGSLGQSWTIYLQTRFLGNGSEIYSAIIGGSDPGLSTDFFIGKRPGDFDFGIQDGNYISSVIPNSNIFDNGWHSLIIISNNGVVKCFVDGTQAASGYNFTGCNSQEVLNIGTEFEGSGYYYNGMIDDVAFWNRALTQQEITNLYNASLPAACPSLPSNLQNGLVGYWPFCGNANDESGNGNHGTVNGATLTTDRFGDSSKAYSFDGISNFISLPQGVLPDQNLSYSISFWAYLSRENGRTESYTIFDDRDSTSFQSKGRFICLGNSLSNFWYQMGDNSPCLGSDFQSGKWYFINCVYDNENNAVKTFMNGALICTEPYIDSRFRTGLRKLNIGKGMSPQFNSVEEWRGVIDDICIWNRALSSSEVTQLYQTQSSKIVDGNIGVNVAAPQRNLHIKHVMRLEPLDVPPSNPVIGDIYMDGILKKLRVYDGTTWQNCW